MKKFFSCLLSFLPFIMFVFTMILLFGIQIAAILIGDSEVPVWFSIVALLMVIICLLMVIVVFAVMIYYIFKACKSPYLEPGTKVMWSILLYVLNIFAFPVFWFLVLRKEFQLEESEESRGKCY